MAMYAIRSLLSVLRIVYRIARISYGVMVLGSCFYQARSNATYACKNQAKMPFKLRFINASNM